MFTIKAPTKCAIESTFIIQHLVAQRAKESYENVAVVLNTIH